MASEIIEELTAIKNTSNVASKQVLGSAKGTRTQKIAKSCASQYPEIKEYDIPRLIRHSGKEESIKANRQKNSEKTRKCQYCDMNHKPR